MPYNDIYKVIAGRESEPGVTYSILEFTSDEYSYCFGVLKNIVYGAER